MHGQTALIPYDPPGLPDVACEVPPDLWVGVSDLADMAGIARQNAHAALTRILNGKTWRGVMPQVRAASNGRGLQVFAPSLPPYLVDVWKARNQGVMAAPHAPAVEMPAPTRLDSGIGERIAKARWKMGIIAPALNFPKGSAQRAETLAEIAARQHRDMKGQLVTYAVDTLRDWCALVETAGDTGLARSRRADAGKRRGFVCRAWDKACPLPDSKKAVIADAIEQHLRSLLSSGASEEKAKSLAGTKLQQLSVAEGWKDAPITDIGLHAVRRWRDYRKLAIKKLDAKRWHDLYTPRIRRTRAALQPMDIVIGDVHPDDQLMPDDGVHQTTHRVIAWLDLATNRIFCTLILCKKGKGINQADVAASFVEMALAWGVPRTLYLDHGSEYKWDEMMSGFTALQGLVEEFRAFIVPASEINDIVDDVDGGAKSPAAPPKSIVRAKPYNAQAKQIEAVFAMLEKFKVMIPGYIGGNRMTKKTHNVGKAPKSFCGTPEQYRETYINDVLTWYHNEPQGGTMDEKSPYQRTREAYAAGWQPFTPSLAIFVFSFAEVLRRKVHHNGIEINGRGYMSEDIVMKIGSVIEVRYAKWHDDHALWINDEGQPVMIPLDAMYHPLDSSGAKRQGKLTSVQNKGYAEMSKTAPPIDIVAEIRRHNTSFPPAPETPSGMPITLEGEAKRIVDVIEEAQAAKPEVTPLPEATPFSLYEIAAQQKKKPGVSADTPSLSIYELFAPKPTRKEAISI